MNGINRVVCSFPFTAREQFTGIRGLNITQSKKKNLEYRGANKINGRSALEREGKTQNVKFNSPTGKPGSEGKLQTVPVPWYWNGAEGNSALIGSWD